jgi:hypothetical protein
LFYLIFGLFYRILFFNWNEDTCGPNQVFDIRSGCPASCLFPNGQADCGLALAVEGCFCRSGYLKDSNGNCVAQNSCGCKSPDNSFVMPINTVYQSPDCLYTYSCSAISILTKTARNCSSNSICTADASGNPVCSCKVGYTGDGINCIQIPAFCTTPDNIQLPVLL